MPRLVEKRMRPSTAFSMISKRAARLSTEVNASLSPRDRSSIALCAPKSLIWTAMFFLMNGMKPGSAGRHKTPKIPRERPGLQIKTDLRCKTFAQKLVLRRSSQCQYLYYRQYQAAKK